MKKRQRFVLFVSLIVVLLLAAGCGKAEVTPDPNAPKPTNPGGVGKAVTLTGDAANGAKLFTDNCVQCHGELGKGGVENQGSEEDVPALNPIDPELANKDAKVFAANIDLYIEHGSTPEGSSPSKVMMAYGDQNIFTPQQIADLIAYVISLNPK